MNSTDALRELAEKVYPVYDVNINGIYFSSRQLRLREQFLSDLTALISEHYYPKEFVEWIIKYCVWDGVFLEYRTREDGKIHEFNSLDELFNYWKENEQ